jgi:hypothetical protein
MIIKCHFDGKVFVPDEPVNAKAGEAVELRTESPAVEFTGGPGAPIGDLLKIDLLGGWDQLEDGVDSAIYARQLRQRASYPNPDKQRALIDLNEYWDEQRLNQAKEERS